MQKVGINLQVTASGNVSKNLSWSGLKNHHLKHDPKQKHENKFLNSEESKSLQKFNTHYKNKRSFDFLVLKYFGNYLYDHDAKTKGYQWGDIKNFIAFDTKGHKRRNSLDFLYMEKFSDKKTWDTLKAKYEKTWAKASPSEKEKWKAKGITSGTDFASYKAGRAVKRYMKGFSDRNPDITFIEGYSHVDELGAPHAHMRLMATPDRERTFTKSGVVKKPSTSLNKALRKQFPEAENNKQALSLWRQQEDKAMVEAFKAELGLSLELYRKKSKVTGLSHDEYIKYQKEKDDLSKKWDALAFEKSNLADAEANLKAETDDFESSLNNSSDRAQLLTATTVSIFAQNRKHRGNFEESDRKFFYDILTKFCMLDPAEAMHYVNDLDDTPSFFAPAEKEKSQSKENDELEL